MKIPVNHGARRDDNNEPLLNDHLLVVISTALIVALIATLLSWCAQPSAAQAVLVGGSAFLGTAAFCHTMSRQ